MKNRLSLRSLIFLFAVLPFSLAAQLFEQPAPIINQARNFVAMEVGDLDGDGDGDLVVGGRADENLAWIAYDGDFEKAQDIDRLVGITCLEIADFDNDGNNDIIAGSQANEKLYHYTNNGDGTFAPRTIIDNSIYRPKDLVAADIDSDGDLDLFCAHNVRVVWYENLGGNFSPRTTIATDLSKLKTIEIADFNADGQLDILCATRFDGVQWIEHSGGGVFSSPVLIADDGEAYAARAADIDGDTDLDVIVTIAPDHKIVYYTNLGGGLFDPVATVVDNSASASYDVYTTDFDADGDSDILGIERPNRLNWYENDGLGSFTKKNVHDEFLNIDQIEIGDINGDGAIDVFGADGSRAAYFENLGGGTFDERKEAIDVVTPYGLMIADLDSDGSQDILVDGNYDAMWFPNAGDGTFNRPDLIGESPILSFPAAFDVNGDGTTDVLDYRQAGKLVYHANLGGGVFDPTPTVLGTYFAWRYRIGDMEGDGDEDILAADSYGSLFWIENVGGGVFASLPFAHYISTDLEDIEDMEILDIDGDGDLDFFLLEVVPFTTTGSVLWFENDGSGSFTRHDILAAGPQFTDLAAGDINLDGQPDLAVASASNLRVSWFKNLGGGAFGSQKVIETATTSVGPTDISVADLDRDGDLEVISCSYDQNRIMYYENISTGTFGPAIDFAGINSGVSEFKVSDIDNDGDIDILYTDPGIDNVFVIENLHTQDCSSVAIGLNSSFTAGSPLGTLQLGWQEISDATDYWVRIEYLSTPIAGRNFYTTTNSLSLTVPLPAGDFRWKVKALCPTEISEWSAYDFFSVPLLRNSAESFGHHPLAEVSISPNPASDWLQVNYLPQNESTYLTISDMRGTVLIQRAYNGNQERIDISSLQTGTYYVTISSPEASSFHLFSKVK